jgi:hypothetical protein
VQDQQLLFFAKKMRVVETDIRTEGYVSCECGAEECGGLHIRVSLM